MKKCKKPNQKRNNFGKFNKSNIPQLNIRQTKETYSIFWLVRALFLFQWKRKPNKYCL